jgi:hypothetical protein
VRSLHAANIALDISVAEIIRNSDVLSLGTDSSEVNGHKMLGITWAATKLIFDDPDCFGNAALKVELRQGVFGCLPVFDKIIQNLMGLDGQILQRSTTEQFAKLLLMTGSSAVVLEHPCVYLCMDKGSESTGAGRGAQGAARRSQFFGDGSFIKDVFATREAFDTAYQRCQPILDNLLSFHEEFEDQKNHSRLRDSIMPFCFRKEQSQQLDTSGILETCIRTLHIKNGKDMMASLEQEILGKRVSRVIDPLSTTALLLGGNCEAEYCRRHAFHRAVIESCSSISATVTKFESFIAFVRNPFVYPKLKYHLDCILGFERNSHFMLGSMRTLKTS